MIVLLTKSWVMLRQAQPGSERLDADYGDKKGSS